MPRQVRGRCDRVAPLVQEQRGDARCAERAPSAGFEPAHMAPEATALSPELRGRKQRGYQGKGVQLLGCRDGAGSTIAVTATCCASTDPFVIRDELRHSLSVALRAAGLPEPPDGVALEPGDPEHGQGDWASPVAMQMARTANLPPREIADRVKAAVESAPPAHLERVDVAGP